MPKSHRNDAIWTISFQGSDPFLKGKIEVWAPDITQAIKQTEIHLPIHRILGATRSGAP